MNEELSLVSQHLITPQDSLVAVVGASSVFSLLIDMTIILSTHTNIRMLNDKNKRNLCYRGNAFSYELLLAVLWLCSLFHTRHHILVICVVSSLNVCIMSIKY